ncbi:MAG: glucuronate isomerase [Bacteroidales bacterium]
MKNFLDKNFLLQNKTAEELYHGYAENLPIIDYHCHLPADEIASDRQFENLTKIWLDGDHYKWRAMRAAGVDEKYCTGNAPDKEKFRQWAWTVPQTLRNPLYHWTHLELRRYFGLNDLLSPETADHIYHYASSLLREPNYSVKNLLRKMKVEVVCTTDDPADALEHHQALAKSNFEIKIFPAFRPDKAMAVENPESYNAYLARLEAVVNRPITHFRDLLEALEERHLFFHKMGCRISDHGLETMYSEPYTEHEIESIFNKVRSGNALQEEEILKFRSCMLYEMAVMDHAAGWVQQYHLGALRNNSTRMFMKVGPDKGFDSIGDFELARPLSRFLDRLDRENKLTKTILYNLNPAHNELIATMAGNFNDGSVPGKMQFGSGWWFLDQKDGIEKQLNTLSAMGLLSRFVGMLTDSRSFLSYPRHEYFRRVLCNLIGTDVEQGLLPNDMNLLGKMVQDICYYNAKKYFGWD